MTPTTAEHSPNTHSLPHAWNPQKPAKEPFGKLHRNNLAPDVKGDIQRGDNPMGRIVCIFPENYKKKPCVPDIIHRMSSDVKQQKHTRKKQVKV